MENGRFTFLSPLGRGGGVGATYEVHLRLIGKRVVNFLSVLIKLLSLGVNTMSISIGVDLTGILGEAWWVLL